MVWQNFRRKAVVKNVWWHRYTTTEFLEPVKYYK
jgi:hypothetical protein